MITDLRSCDALTLLLEQGFNRVSAWCRGDWDGAFRAAGRMAVLAPRSEDAASPLEAQLRTYCITGSRFTCFGIQIVTTPSGDGGANVVVRVANRQGATMTGVTSQVPWSRLFRIL